MQYFYDLTWERQTGGELTSDTEGNLVVLCRRCAGVYRSITAWAGAADDGASCEACGGYDDAPGMLSAQAVERLLATLSGDERQRVARLVQSTGAPIPMAIAAIRAQR